MGATIIWFRQDLRLEDNPAWQRAVETGLPVIPVYILAMDETGRWAPGGASCWWLHHALEDLAEKLSSLGMKLIFRSGESGAVLEQLIAESNATAVYWNRCYEPNRMRVDGQIKSGLKASGIEAWSGNASLLFEPWEAATQAGNAYKVFTPFSRAVAKLSLREPVQTTGNPVAPSSWPASESLPELGLLPGKGWGEGLAEFWTPTRAGGLGRLGAFLKHHSSDYADARDTPAVDGTSRLSPYLHFGQIGPREVVAAIGHRRSGKGLDTFHRELLWREFAHHVLYHFPDTPEHPLQTRFCDFPWRSAASDLSAWRKGKTGYPIVDAGMRQLWKTGWMHNRVRMIVGSFLVKHLLLSWEEGAAWFWDTLVDADLASNTLGWQWAGGCGADAAPYFRIFNPILQGQKFDPEGDFIRTYVPELNNVPNTYLHTPWEMPGEVQQKAGCVLGKDYAFPVIEHKAGRARALEALESLKGAS